MKAKLICLTMIFAAMVILFPGCKKEKVPLPQLPDISVVDISGESNWDYWVVGKENYYYIKEKNSLPETVLFHSFGNNKDYSIFFKDNGLPGKVLVDGYIFLFDNFNGNKVDLGIISPEGEIRIFREIETDFNWDNDLLKSAKSTKAPSDIIRWTGRILGAVPCVTSGVAAFTSGGLTIPLALWTCGNYFLGLAANIEEDYKIHNGFTEFVDTYSLVTTSYSCNVTVYVDPSSCVIALVQKGTEALADYMGEIERRSEDIQVTEAALYAGYGDIQITLTWDNTSDLDLHVIDPYGEEIYWDHKFSSSGGTLDYDHIDGYGPENIYWPKSQAPNGTYQVFVHDYVWLGKPESANYTVLVNAFGRVKKFTGSISLNESVHITNFDENNLKSAKSSAIPKITLEHIKQR